MRNFLLIIISLVFAVGCAHTRIEPKSFTDEERLDILSKYESIYSFRYESFTRDPGAPTPTPTPGTEKCYAIMNKFVSDKNDRLYYYLMGVSGGSLVILRSEGVDEEGNFINLKMFVMNPEAETAENQKKAPAQVDGQCETTLNGNQVIFDYREF